MKNTRPDETREEPDKSIPTHTVPNQPSSSSNQLPNRSRYEQRNSDWQTSVIAGATQREPSRTPRSRIADTMNVNPAISQSNYVTAFHEYYRQKLKTQTERYHFTNNTPKSINPSRLTHNDWNSLVLETSTEVLQEDMPILITQERLPSRPISGR